MQILKVLLGEISHSTDQLRELTRGLGADVIFGCFADLAQLLLNLNTAKLGVSMDMVIGKGVFACDGA